MGCWFEGHGVDAQSKAFPVDPPAPTEPEMFWLKGSLRDTRGKFYVEWREKYIEIYPAVYWTKNINVSILYKFF